MGMSDPNEILSQFNALKSRYQRAADTFNFTDLSRELGDLTGKITALPNDIANLRTRRYVFAKFLEHKAEVLTHHWNEIAQQAQTLLQSEVDALRSQAQQANTLIMKGDNAISTPKALVTVLPMLESALEQLESSAEAATARIRGAYQTVANDIHQTVEQIRKINWYLDERDEASFDFLAGESLFLAADAEWVQTGKGGKDPDGVLFLTDQRLIFEQKEKTGKTLGLFGGKKTQELEWEIPLNLVQSVEAENKGVLGGKDMLNFTLNSGAPYAKLTVEVKGGVQSKFWAAQIERMVRGETEDERAIAPDPETVAAVRNAPTACHVCGATLPRLVANQTQIECEYCGSIIRL